MRIKSRIAILLLVLSVTVIYNFVSIRTYEDAINTNLCTEVKLPIVMYHSFLKDNSKHGKFVISPEQFEEDIRYIINRGYTPVHISELIAFCRGDGVLPDNPIMITIDDGYYNNYLYAFPILQKYNVKAVISPIMKYSELYTVSGESNTYYSHITYRQGREMAESGLVEFQNHTYDMHKDQGARYGIRRMPSETNEQYQKALYDDLSRAHKLMTENFGVSPAALSMPFGSYGTGLDAVADKLGYEVTLSSVEGINSISKGGSLKNLRRYNRPHGISTAEFYNELLAENTK